MTQKEKQEYMRERERLMRREMKVTNSNKLAESTMKKLKPISGVALKSETKTSLNDISELGPKSTQKPIRNGFSASTTSQREESTTQDAKKTLSAKIAARPEKPKIQSDGPKPVQTSNSTGKPKASVQSSEERDKPEKSKLQSINDKHKAMLLRKAKEQYYAQQRKNAIPTKPSVEQEDSRLMKTPMKKSSDISDNRDSRPSDRKAVQHSSAVKKIQPGQAVREFPPRDAVRPSDRNRDPPRDTAKPSERGRELPARDSVRPSERSREFPPRDTVRQFPPPDMMRKKPASKPMPVRRSKCAN